MTKPIEEQIEKQVIILGGWLDTANRIKTTVDGLKRLAKKQEIPGRVTSATATHGVQ